MGEGAKLGVSVETHWCVCVCTLVLSSPLASLMFASNTPGTSVTSKWKVKFRAIDQEVIRPHNKRGSKNWPAQMESVVDTKIFHAIFD